LDIVQFPLTTARYNTVSDLEPIRPAWNILADGEPMRSPEWLLSWFEIYASPDDELCVLTFSDPGGVIVGLAPLYLQGKKNGATYRPLGSGDFCTQHFNWLTAPLWENRIGMEVGRYFLQNRSLWKRLFFNTIDADAAAVHTTVNYLAENGCLCHQRNINSNWAIALPMTWDDYLLKVSRSLRKRCRKLQKEFFDSGKILLRQIEREEDLPAGWEILLKLHAARWKNAKKPLGIFSDERFLSFHKTVSSHLMRQGKLRFAWIEHNGTPIAAEYQFLGPKTLYAYQAGIDLAMDLYSAGKLSIMASIQFAIQNGCAFFDLLNGDDPYKANWRATPVVCHDFRVWQKRGRGFFEWTIWSAYSLAVRHLKPILPHRLIIMILTAFHKTIDFYRLRLQQKSQQH